jgi:LPS-assembly lipoprotein
LSYRRALSRRHALIGLLAVAGCGLSPAYGPGGTAQRLHGQITYDTPRTIPGFWLEDRLQDRLGTPQSPRYRLVISLSEARDQAAVTADGDITRQSLIGMVTWELHNADGPIGKGTVQTFTSYDATGSTVASMTAEEDARQRLSTGLADLVVADLLLLPLP